MNKNIEEMILKKEYKSASDAIIAFLNSIDRNTIENWISYKEILVYKSLNKEYYENFIKPLTKKISIDFPEIENYTQQVSIINEVFEYLLENLEEDYQVYKGENLLFVVCRIISQYENFIHDLNKILNENENNPMIDKIMNINQTNIEMAINSLNRMLRKIFSEKNKFTNMGNIKDYREFIKKISGGDFINIMCKLNSTDDVLEMVKANEVNVVAYDYENDEFKLKYPVKRMVKFDLPKLRQRTFDNINFIKYHKKSPQNLKILKGENIRSFVEMGEDAFKLKVDLLSEEFMINIKTILVDALRFTEFILFENYIDINKISENVVIHGNRMKFTFDDLIYCHIAILGLANYYYIAEELFDCEKQKHSITSLINLKKENLNSIIVAICSYCLNKMITKDVVDEVIDFYTYGSYDIWDVFCTPLICIGQQYIISPSVIMATNFGRVFIEHINKLEIEFKKGDIFEENFKLMLKEHDFEVYTPEKSQLNFTTAKGHIGDIDVLAIKDDYIFCAQLKNRPMPLERQEFINYDRKLHKALKQLKYVEEFLAENPKKILDFYDLRDLGKFKIIKFNVSNSFYRSGECIEDIYITDMSALNVLFDSGKITVRDGEKDIIKYLRKNDKVKAEELENFLKEPYFMQKGVYL